MCNDTFPKVLISEYHTARMPAIIAAGYLSKEKNVGVVVGISPWLWGCRYKQMYNMIPNISAFEMFAMR